MKPVKLILSAFGSYGGAECVDFEKMKQGLFLITGDTGSGKTTIFDGISYALYGQTSGRRRDGDMMRSQYAKDTEETYVEFTFEEGGRRYIIRRNPNWLRRSKRKNKDGEYPLTKVSAKVELIMPDGTMFPGKMKETDQKIVEIIGMDMNQFSQVSMISQGDFMKLLLATSRERKEIFSKIFPTQIYWRVQMQLKDHAKQLYIQLENIRNRCRTEIENVQCLPDSAYADEWLEKGHFSDIDNAEVLELLEKINMEAEAKEKDIHSSVAIVEKALEAYRVMDEKKKDYDTLLNDTKKLEKDIQVLIEEVEEKQKRLSVTREIYDEEWQVKQNQIFMIRQEMPEYDRLDSERKSLDNIRRELKNCQENIKDRKETMESLLKRLNDIESEQEKLKDSSAHKVEVEQSLIKYQETLEKVKLLLEKQEIWDKLILEQENGKKQLEIKLKWYQKASSHYDQMYERFIASQAGLMARDLVDGKPCPVCGSLHHPAPHKMETTNAMVDQTMVENAKNIRERAQEDVESAREFYANISNQGIALKNRLLQEASSWMKDAENLLETGIFWGCVADEVKSNKTLCVDLKKRLKQLEFDMDTFEANKGILKNIEEQQKKTQEKHLDLIQKCAVLETEEKQHREVVQAIGEKLQYASKKEAEQQVLKLETELNQLKERLEKQEMALEKDKNKLRLKQGQLTERKEKLEQIQKEAEQSRRVYIQMMQKNAWEEDMDLRQLERMKKIRMDEEKKIYGIRQSNQNVHKHLKEILYNYKNEQNHFSQVWQLSRIANGELPGAAKIDFQTYMQRCYFKQMVQAANRRLAGMSRNQFLLECRDMDNLGRQGEVGLDLDVYSLVNDQIRDIKTLSGGESFMAALALALGMADVIQQEAGKIHVDTLFIDEGFGSLDENARNQAVRILNELAGGERLVGIISHVNELKEQIEQKIQVIKTEHGSQIDSCHLI